MLLNCDRPRPTTMRLTNFLLVAAAAVLASCEAVSAVTDSTQTKLSTMTSPDAVQSTDVVHDGKRFLRTTKTEKYEVDDDEDDENDSYDVEEEERANLLQPYINRYGTAWVDKWAGKANDWASAGKKLGQIKEKLQGLGSSLSPEAKDKYDLFNAAYLKKHPGGI
ncbi:hypothetical protein BBJ29_010138 [Phytophthora kernoviae]|uniref:RxLR effector protein n=1 Tax=Phytophthora kernoviae TaxID=325452 RepID=A0A3F2REJ9_9STRA|nr:hypothetical protein BBP00_00008779 [Phytophthora kernoviae]RLN57520.1 hypothetical protein BBJ29_010138 [Phytophthora kernoviae]